MTQNTIENKQRFFALYLGQEVLKGNAKNQDKHTVTTTLLSKDWLSGQTCLELRPLSQITDEEAIEVAKLAHQMPNREFKIVRRYPYDSVHVEYLDESIQCVYHVCVNKYGEINSNQHFLKTEKDDPKRYEINIGTVRLSVDLPLPYVAITDYLRSRGFLLPFMDLSVEQILAYGWAKLKP